MSENNLPVNSSGKYNKVIYCLQLGFLEFMGYIHFMRGENKKEYTF